MADGILQEVGPGSRSRPHCIKSPVLLGNWGNQETKEMVSVVCVTEISKTFPEVTHPNWLLMFVQVAFTIMSIIRRFPNVCWWFLSSSRSMTPHTVWGSDWSDPVRPQDGLCSISKDLGSSRRVSGSCLSFLFLSTCWCVGAGMNRVHRRQFFSSVLESSWVDGFFVVHFWRCWSHQIQVSISYGSPDMFSMDCTGLNVGLKWSVDRLSFTW